METSTEMEELGTVLLSTVCDEEETTYNSQLQGLYSVAALVHN